MKKTIKKTKPTELGLTDRSRVQQALRNSELRYRRLFETSRDGILILDAKTGAITDVNPHLIDLLGYSREELIEKKLWQVGAFQDVQASKDAFEALQRNEYIRYENLPLKAKDGRLIQVEFVSNVYLVGDDQVIQCNIRDITQHNRLVAALRKNERKYHALVTQSPDGICLVDSSGNLSTVNKAMCDGLGFSEEELCSMNIRDIIPERYLDQYRQRLTRILSGESLIEPSEYTVRGKDGQTLYIEVLSVPYYSEEGIIGFQGIARDITARKQAEEVLRQSQKSLTEAQRVGQLGSWDWDAKTGTITWSEEYYHIYGCDPTQPPPAYKEHLKAYTSESAARLDAVAKQCMQNGEAYELDLELACPNGTRRWVSARGECKRDAHGHIVGLRGTEQDITERKQRDARHRAIATVSAALHTAPSRAEMLPGILDQLLALLHADGAALAMRDPVSGDTVVEGSAGEFTNRLCERLAPGEGVSGYVIASGKPFVTSDIRSEAGIARADVFETVRAVACVPLAVQDQVIGAVWVGRQSEISADEVRLLTAIADIAASAIYRETLREQIVRQLHRLEALQSIDIAISASMDLQMTLNILLKHVKNQLNADATDILLLNEHSQTLEYAAGHGFRTRTAQTARIRLGESFAGRAALEHCTIQASDPAQIQKSAQFAAFWAGEGFAAYFGVPLIAKGKVKGVLEVYHRVPFHAEPDWISFLETLAGQASIAIESGQLFVTLQRSNADLVVAYEATIEGWSHALDLRDKETEGHTRRVTEMTMGLAKAMGIGDADLVHIRHGALLHDIGKMGVPDGILLKPGELTDQEWVVMRKHPQLAYDLLSSITYLRAALDIPYCHHEKWDGTGYPRGLKGEQIPLAARLFAVADVWDALRSDRPYRKAWDEDKVREHILAGRGTHFDPKAVETFLRVIAEK